MKTGAGREENVLFGWFLSHPGTIIHLSILRMSKKHMHTDKEWTLHIYEGKTTEKKKEEMACEQGKKCFLKGKSGSFL